MEEPQDLKSTFITLRPMKEKRLNKKRIISGGVALLVWTFGVNAQVWETLGSSWFSNGNGDYPAIVLDAGGNPYVAYRHAMSGSKMHVKHWNGTSWSNVGPVGFSDGGADQISIALGTDGRPWVAYRDGNHGNKATVKRWTGSSWTTVGTEGFSNGQAYYNCLSIASDGTPYMAGRDGTPGPAVVRYWDGSAWNILGGSAVSAGNASYVGMALDGNGYPVVAYQDATKGSRTTVKRWDGSSWVAVGIAGFGQHGSDNSMALASDGTPYVAYRNLNNGTKVSVMKWDGSTWAYVGVNGISDGASRHVCVAMDPDDHPVVAYKDEANGDGVTVKRWDGTNWITVGPSGFTAAVTFAGVYASRWMAIDNIGRILFAHRAGNVLYAKRNTCGGDQVVVAIETDGNASQTTWEIVDSNDHLLAGGGPYSGLNNTLIVESVCLSGGSAADCYGFRLMDSFGDGITGGSWELRTTDGKLVLRDEFSDGASSPVNPPLYGSYGDYHSFCLPLAAPDVHPAECGVFDNRSDNKVFANKVAGTNYLGGTLNYQFEFSDPDSGYIRRIKKPRNYIVFSELNPSPLKGGKHYFTRVRTDKAGPVADAHWGAGCEMGLGTTVNCTQLIEAPTYGHSCNETRRYGPSSFIYAQPVFGASQYEFRIFNTGEGYDETYVRNTYILELNGFANPLVDGYSYQVQVRAKVSDTWGSYCGTCSITIDNQQQMLDQHLVQAAGEATLWPNPARDGQVYLNIDGIEAATQQITVDVKDIYGQQVYGQAFGNSGERFSTVLNLPGDIASGVYLVNITVNGEVTTHRLSIVR